MRIEFDPEAMTLGDIEDFETVSGMSIAAVKPGELPPMKAVTALIWLMRRKEDPAFTLDQARAMRFDEVSFADPLSGPDGSESGSDRSPSSSTSAPNSSGG